MFFMPDDLAKRFSTALLFLHVCVSYVMAQQVVGRAIHVRLVVCFSQSLFDLCFHFKMSALCTKHCGWWWCADFEEEDGISDVKVDTPSSIESAGVSLGVLLFRNRCARATISIVSAIKNKYFHQRFNQKSSRCLRRPAQQIQRKNRQTSETLSLTVTKS